ncbi:hypothetical protein D9757_001096 [Collybiopsis confluens]|uniref:DUF6535 domain-containing protein n=1 Tax=Collybiopsis confluens TaxID=2823264 RepID=A0A8H5I0Q2_9AGAR|nr:hypothetical protein D9757_001096 [Collybiopsis confluens]
MGSGPKHLFGLPQNLNKDQRAFNAEDDYEQRFPEDPTFRETGPNARVWRTYLAESAVFDDNMIGEARDGLDSMLVFAGLFSAVVTSFLIEASQNLQADYTQLSATLLYELVSNSGGSSLSPPNPASEFVPGARDVWINGLWAISLTFSLVVALASVLIKQWLRRYLTFRSGTPAERSHLRQYRFMGFETWKVSTIVGSLPVIMHLSLGLFLIGLVLFFIPLHFALSCVIGGITLAVYVLYFASNILPIFFPRCPYRTPFSAFFLFLGSSFRHFVALGFRIKFLNARSDTDAIANDLQPSLDDLESSAVQVEVEDVVHPLSVHALYWLFSTSTSPSVHSIVLQAIGGLPAHNKVREAVQSLFNFERDCQPTLKHLIFSCTSDSDLYTRVPIPHLESVLERFCRTLLFFPVDYGQLFGPFGYLKYESRPNDPESVLRKATFLTVQTEYPDGQDYLNFMVNNRSAKHHFFVWEAFWKNASGYARGYEYSTKDILSYYHDLICQEQTFEAFDPSLNEVPFMDAFAKLQVSQDYTPLLHSLMLGMLTEPNLHPRLPPNNRFIEAMLQFLLHHVWDDLPESEFRKHLCNLIDCFDTVDADRIFHEDESCDFSMSSFIINLCEKWMSRPDYQPSALDQLLAEKVKIYWEAKLVGPSERRILRRAIASGNTFGDFAVLMIGVFDALRNGSVEAHRSPIDDNYLVLLFDYYKNHPPADTIPDLVGAFVTQLEYWQETDSPEQAKCVKHLFEPQNSRYAIILLILESDRQGFRKELSIPYIFVGLCPQRQLLCELRDWMELVAKFLDATHEEDKGRLKEEIGMDPLLSSDQHSKLIKDFIYLLDNRLARTPVLPDLELVQWRPQIAEHARTIPGSSAPQEHQDVADTRPSSPPRTATLLWRKGRDMVQRVGKQNLEKSPPNIDGLPV